MKGDGPVIVGMNVLSAVNNRLQNVADYIFGNDDSDDKKAFNE